MNFDYAARQIGAVWKMARNDERWKAELDRSVDGVFRSFWAMAFAAPIAFAGYFSLRRAADRMPELHAAALMHAPYAVILSAQIAAFAIDWIAGLAALVLLARASGAGKRAADLIIGYNWAQPLATAAQAVPLIVLGVTASRPVTSIFYLPAMIFVLLLFWGVLRRSLGAGVAMTIGLIVTLMLIGVIVGTLVNGVALGLYRMAS
jgi:hypothetical protein